MALPKQPQTEDNGNNMEKKTRSSLALYASTERYLIKALFTEIHINWYCNSTRADRSTSATISIKWHVATVSIWWKCFMALCLIFYSVAGESDEKCPPYEISMMDECTICICTKYGKPACRKLWGCLLKYLPDKDKIAGKFLGIGTALWFIGKAAFGELVGWAAKQAAQQIKKG